MVRFLKEPIISIQKSKEQKDRCTGTMIVTKERKLILQKGAVFGPLTQKSPMAWMDIRKELSVKNNVLQEDLECSSPSMAAAIVCGHNKNGWMA